MTFDVEVQAHGAATIARIIGELDIATTPTLEAAVEAAAGSGPVILDLTPTAFIDSTACRYFVQLAKRAAGGGPEVDFVCPESNYEVWRVLDILGLTETLGVRGTLDG